MGKNKNKNKKRASQDAQTPTGNLGEPENGDHPTSPASPHVLSTPTSSTQQPSVDDPIQQPSATDATDEQIVVKSPLKQSDVEDVEGAHDLQADEYVDQSQSVGDEEMTVTNTEERNGIQSEMQVNIDENSQKTPTAKVHTVSNITEERDQDEGRQEEHPTLGEETILVAEEDTDINETKQHSTPKRSLGSPAPEHEPFVENEFANERTEHSASNEADQLQGNERAGTEANPDERLSTPGIDEGIQHNYGDAPDVLEEPVTGTQGSRDEDTDTTPASGLDEAVSLDQISGPQDLQPSDMAAQGSIGGGQQQLEDENNDTEEVQVHTESAVQEGRSTGGDNQGGHGPDAVQQSEKALSPVDSPQQEEAQERGNHDEFFDTLEQPLDDADEDKTLNEDHDTADAEPQASMAAHEQIGGAEYFQGQERNVEGVEYLEEQKADAWGSCSPDEANHYELQIIVEQPEDDLEDDCDTPTFPGEHTLKFDMNAAEDEDTAYMRNGQNQDLAADMHQLRAGAIFEISAKEIASKDLLAIANLFANMKSALSTMTTAFGRLGVQTEKMASFGLDVKAAQQLQQIKSSLEMQIADHRAVAQSLKDTLQAKIKEAVESTVRDRLRDVIRESVRAAVEERVRQELSAQIPEDLRKQVISHKRHILEVRASLHNSEARMYNALQTMPDLNAPLRPLLRPLPTPEQSPVVISISRSSSMGYSTLPTPATAFPRGPAPTPIKRAASNPYRSVISDTVPPSPSPYFPRDMTTLFALNPEETKRLLREYGLTSAAASPATEHPTRPRGLSIVNEDAAEEDPDIHARDLNKFMAHIGVPFLMIPAPQEKHYETAPLSSRSRRRLLTPLIIK